MENDLSTFTQLFNLQLGQILDKYVADPTISQICMDGGVSTLGACFALYLRDGCFDAIQGLSDAQKQMLLRFCKDLTTPRENRNLLALDAELKDVGDQGHLSLQPVSRADITDLEALRRIKLLMQSYSVRLQNRVREMLDGVDRDPWRFMEALTMAYPDFLEIPHVGKKTAQEFAQLFDQISSQLRLPRSETILELNLVKLLDGSPDLIKTILKRSASPEGEGYRILFLLSQLIASHILCSERTLLILKGRTQLLSSSVPQTYEEIGLTLGITRERVRQLSQFDKLVEPFLQCIRQCIELVRPYGFCEEIAFNGEFPIVCLTEEELDCSMTYQFSAVFYGWLIAQISDAHQFLPSLTDHDDWRYHYLIRQDLHPDFWESWVDGLRATFESQDYLDYRIHLDNEVPDYVENADVRSVSETLLYREFNLNVDNGLAERSPEVYRQKDKLAYVLAKLDKPASVDVLLDEAQRFFPDDFPSLSEIRGTVATNPDIFMLLGRSTYGLRRWEKRGYIGGTITSLIVRYLEESAEPRHIYDIAKFILEHRDTRLENVRSLIHLNTMGHFLPFGNDFYGLISKKESYGDCDFQPIPMRLADTILHACLEPAGGVLRVDDLLERLCPRYHLTPAQILYTLDRHADQDKWTIEEGYLKIL